MGTRAWQQWRGCRQHACPMHTSPPPPPLLHPCRSEIQTYAGEVFRHNGITLRLGAR